MANPNALGFYKKVSEDARTYYLPHHLFVSQNLYANSGACGSSQILYKPFPFRSSLPIPITSPAALKVNDPCCQYTSSKDAWKYKIRIMKTAHRKLMKRKMTEIKLNCNGAAEVPVYLLKFTRLLHDDPDPYFDCYYNWYLSGNGNCCLIDIAGTTYVLKSSGNELDIQNLESIQKHSEKYVCEDQGLIHETIFQGMSQGVFIGLRQKHQINLIRLESNEESTEAIPLKSIHSEIPFTSFAFDDVHNGVITTNANGTIQIYDMDADTTIDIINNNAHSKIVNNWSSTQLFGSNSILQTSKNHITILDDRDQQNCHNISPVFQMDCDNMTSSKICSSKPNYVFMGTIHNLFVCDMRYLKTDTFVAKWSHGLKSPPLFISTEAFEDREIIAISSQLADDSCIVIHSFKEFEDTKMEDFNVSDSEIYFPWHPPCIKKTLENSQKLGLCLDPTVNLKKRFQMSTTGIKFWNNQNNFNLLTLNSAGDVFSQKLDWEQTKHFDEGDTSHYTHLHSWAEQLHKDRLLFTVSSQINMCNLQSALKNSYRQKVQKRKSQKFLAYKNRWKQSLKGLNDYTDMWANELLSVWENDETDRKIDSLIPPPADTKFKVDTWMNQFSAEDDIK